MSGHHSNMLHSGYFSLLYKRTTVGNIEANDAHAVLVEDTLGQIPKLFLARNLTFCMFSQKWF